MFDQQVVRIAVTGAVLVTASLAFLWGLIALMVRVTSPKRVEISSQDKPEEDNDLECKQLAAVAGLAVAVQMAGVNRSGSEFQKKDELSPWQVFHRNQEFGKNRTGKMV